MSMDLMPYFSSYLFSTKKFFHSTSKSTKVEVATKVKVIYVNNKRWGGADVLCVSSYASIPRPCFLCIFVSTTDIIY